MISRRALAGAWAILPLAVLLAALALLAPPEQVPTRWADGSVEGYAGGAAFASVILTTTVLGAFVAALSAVLQRVVPPSWARWVLAVTGAVGWGAASLYIVTAWRVGVTGAHGVGEGWIVLPLLLALAAGWVGHAVHGRRRPSEQELALLVPDRVRVRPVRGRAVRAVEPWATEVSCRTMQVIGWGLLGAFAVGVGAMVLMGRSAVLTALVGLFGLVAGLLALSWSRVRYEVDEDALAVRSRVLPVRVLRVPVEEVAGVAVQELDAMRWGGIGLRTSPERTAYLADAGGPGLVLHRRDGRRVALQVTQGDAVARDGARSLSRAAGQRLGASASAGPASAS